MTCAYYNEIDPYCAQWLRNLITAGHIPAGEVDERDIREVSGDDLKGFGACHFFAGIGGWAYAARLADIPDDRPIWTGSCPCQPLSSAGQRKGHADERHLWPAFHALIAERRPTTVFGEQVASKDGREWLAGVRADLEHLGYAVGAADLPAAGVGSPQIRQRLWWMADARSDGQRQREHAGDLVRSAETEPKHEQKFVPDCVISSGPDGGLALADGGDTGPEGLQRGGEQRQQPQDGGVAERMEHASGDGRLERRAEPSGRGVASGCGPGGVGHAKKQPWGGKDNEDAPIGHTRSVRMPSLPSGLAGSTSAGLSDSERQGETGQSRSQYAGDVGFWSDFDFIPCGDGKARRVEPGTFPLAHGIPARVGKLRAYGNAIVPQVAAEFMRCCP